VTLFNYLVEGEMALNSECYHCSQTQTLMRLQCQLIVLSLKRQQHCIAMLAAHVQITTLCLKKCTNFETVQLKIKRLNFDEI